MLFVTGPVLCEASEDETAIQASVVWDQNTDSLIGFCGAKSDTHACQPDCSVTVGDFYEQLVTAFQNNVIGSHARVIMINPLHPNLPSLPIYMMPTCNKFTADHVSRMGGTLQAL